MLATGPVNGGEVDLTVTTYVDDLRNVHPLSSNAAEETGKALRMSNGTLSKLLQQGRFAQNTTRQVVVPAYREQGAVQAYRRLRQLMHEDDGSLKLAARYLGPILAPTRCMPIEREARFRAARKAWRSMGCFWSSRTVF